MTDATGGPAVIVLVANPDEQVRELVARVVEDGGHEAVRLDPEADVATAVTASAAAAVVLDLGAGNLDALNAVRTVSAETRVIVLDTGPAGGRLAWNAGADGFLVRPFHARELQAQVTDALERDEVARAALRRAQAEALSA